MTQAIPHADDYKLPLKITEHPHQGKPRTWTLEDEKHLQRCIDATARQGYDDWCIENGYAALSVEDGSILPERDQRRQLNTYLDWLRHDLKNLDVEEVGSRQLPADMKAMKDAGRLEIVDARTPFPPRKPTSGGMKF